MTSHTDSIEQLTFGVEIEFLLAFPRVEIQQHIEDEIKRVLAGRDPNIQREKCIRIPLRQAGLRVSSQTEDFRKTYSEWFVKSDGSIDFLENEFTGSMRCSNGDEIHKYGDMKYCSIEVVSPILPLAVEGLQQVQCKAVTAIAPNVMSVLTSLEGERARDLVPSLYAGLRGSEVHVTFRLLCVSYRDSKY